MTNDGSSDITINTNDNDNENTGSPMELKIVTSNGVNEVVNIMSLTILPDCSQEDVIVPVFTSSYDYTIYESEKIILINPFSVSRAYCVVEEIYVDEENMINATAVSEFVQFNPDTIEFTIQTDDN